MEHDFELVEFWKCVKCGKKAMSTIEMEDLEEEECNGALLKHGKLKEKEEIKRKEEILEKRNEIWNELFSIKSKRPSVDIFFKKLGQINALSWVLGLNNLNIKLVLDDDRNHGKKRV